MRIRLSTKGCEPDRKVIHDGGMRWSCMGVLQAFSVLAMIGRTDGSYDGAARTKGAPCIFLPQAPMIDGMS